MLRGWNGTLARDNSLLLGPNAILAGAEALLRGRGGFLAGVNTLLCGSDTLLAPYDAIPGGRKLMLPQPMCSPSTSRSVHRHTNFLLMKGDTMLAGSDRKPNSVEGTLASPKSLLCGS